MSYGNYWPFSVWSMVCPYTKMVKNATIDISIQDFHNITRHYVKDTVFYFLSKYFPILKWDIECTLLSR